VSSGKSREEVMKRRIAVLTLSPLLFALCFPVLAQQPTKSPRIGFLSATNAATDASRIEAIQAALRELGYIEGKNIAFEYRYAEGKGSRAPELPADLVRLNADIILVLGGEQMIRAAKNATKTIPIVMSGRGPDPIEAGLIQSLARPGGNVTGITLLSRDLGPKRLEVLKEIVPKMARVAVIFDPATTSSAQEVKEILPGPARALGLSLQAWEVRALEDFDNVFAAMSKERPDGLYVPGGGALIRGANERRIAGFALKSRLPSAYDNSEAVDAGGLMYCGTDVEAAYPRIAYYVDRILKGARPADLPVEQPTKFELVVNLKTAKQIGVTIPQLVLMRANRVVK
jgi:putative tryptophan/tyrosine transport system substrate-binding protein